MGVVVDVSDQWEGIDMIRPHGVARLHNRGDTAKHYIHYGRRLGSFYGTRMPPACETGEMKRGRLEASAKNVLYRTESWILAATGLTQRLS